MRNLQTYIDDALELSSKGYFFSKSQQKEALDNLNRAYDVIQNTKYDSEMAQKATPEERWGLVCDMPHALHLVKEKHRPIFEKLGMDWDTVVKLVEYRNEFKNFEIVPKAKENNDFAQVMQFIVSGVQSNFQDDGRNYLKEKLGEDLYRRVRWDWHFVRNSRGTDFIRVFWFLDGRITKLQSILAMGVK